MSDQTTTEMKHIFADDSSECREDFMELFGKIVGGEDLSDKELAGLSDANLRWCIGDVFWAVDTMAESCTTDKTIWLLKVLIEWFNSPEYLEHLQSRLETIH